MCTNNSPSGGLLEVEDEEQRGMRIQATLSKLNASSGSGSWASTSPPDFSFLNRDSRTRPHAVSPPTELLNRVQAFLPALHASNTLLAKRAREDPASVDIECLDKDENTGGYVEMNLGLGLFDMHSNSHHLAHTFGSEGSTMSCSSSYSSSSGASSFSSSSSGSYSHSNSDYHDDSDSDEEAEIITSWRPIRPVRPLPRRASAHAHANNVGAGIRAGDTNTDKEMGEPGPG